MRKPWLGVFFLIDFLILTFEFDLIIILDSGSISVKDVQTYLYNLIEAEPEPKSNRASDTNNTDDADDTNDANDTDDVDDTDDIDDADDTDDTDDADNADDADADNADD